MKDSYIENSFPRYFIHGEHPDGVRVDIESLPRGTIATVTRAEARTLIEDRNTVIDRLITLARKFEEVNDKEFTECWYGK